MDRTGDGGNNVIGLSLIEVNALLLRNQAQIHDFGQGATLAEGVGFMHFVCKAFDLSETKQQRGGCAVT